MIKEDYEEKIIENFNKKVAKNIEKAIIDKSLNKKKVAEKLGVQAQTVSAIFRKLKKGQTVNNTTLCKWAVAIGVHPSAFFVNNDN